MFIQYLFLGFMVTVVILNKGKERLEGELAGRVAQPLFLSRVSAGFPSPADDYIEQSLDLHQLCVKHPSATFFVRVEGDSMIDAGIFEKDILVVDRSLEAKQGDIVIATLYGELTVKRLQLTPYPALIPCNQYYSPIPLAEESELDIFGVVTHALHSFKEFS